MHTPPHHATPTKRCFEQSIPCELVANSGKKGAAVAAALPSPTERVNAIMTVANFGSLAETYTQGIVRAHESGLVCRRQALRVLVSTRWTGDRHTKSYQPPPFYLTHNFHPAAR